MAKAFLLASGVSAALIGVTANSNASPIPVASCTPAPPAASADRPRYRVTMTFDPTLGRVTGSFNIAFTPDQPIDRVIFRLWPNGGARDASAPRIALKSTSVAVAATPETRVTPILDSPTVVRLPVKVATGQVVNLSGDFVVDVPGERNDRISVSRSGNRAFVAARLGSFIPVLAWEPGVGWNLTPPTRTGAEASMTAAADWDVSVAIAGQPALNSDLSILASGEQVQPGRWISAGQRDWAMSVGRFNEATGSLVMSTVSLGPGRPNVKVIVGVAAPLTESASVYRTRVIRAIRTLSNIYGDYPWPTYVLAITPGLKGGIEFPSHVMQGPGSTGRTTTHEVAHQWFYALVGNDQGRDPWIDEGLATWAEARAELTLAAFAAKPIPADGAGRAGSPMSYWDKHRSSYYRSVYVQTLQALNALGDPDRVDVALRCLIASKGNQVVRPPDVLGALTEQFPDAPAVMRRYGIVANRP